MADAGFSLKEAAVLAEISEKSIRHELAREIATPERRPIGASVRRRLDERDILYLNLLAALPVSLGVADRRDLYAMITRRLRATGRWRRTGDRLRLIGAVPVEIDASELRKRLAGRLRLYRRGRARLVARPDLVGGEPVFKGTRVPVRHIGLLARKNVPVAEILEDYPALDENDVAFARLFVELRPDPGRPRKPLAFARDG
ncbi:MAG: DUF433 domain-containing protein [Geminicoccaceae bacterium]